MSKRKFRMIFLIPAAALAFTALPAWAQTGTDNRTQRGTGAAPTTGGDAAVTGQSATGRTQSAPVTPQSSAGMAASSEEIQKLQQALKDRGQDPGTVNGVMTPQTQQALRAFQAQQGLNATGTLDAQTRTALGLGLGAGNNPSSARAANATGSGLGTPIDPTLMPGQEAVPGSTSRGTSPPAPSRGLGTGSTSWGLGNPSVAPGTAGGGASGAGGVGGAAGAGGAGGGK